MSNDRELLEKAAKAAGVTIRDSTRWATTVVRQVTLDDGSLNWVRWNPLANDGPALRLASALSIDILHRYVGGQRVEALAPGGGLVTELLSNNANDRAAATRRAIVRAAAALSTDGSGHER